MKGQGGWSALGGTYRGGGGRKNLPKVFGKYGQKFQASKRKKRPSKIFRNYMQKNLDLWHEVSGKFKIHPGQQTP